MAIINQNLHPSEQRIVIQQEYAPTNLVTGSTNIIFTAPTACNLDFVQYSAFGSSGSPTLQVIVNRFIPGTGFTAFNLGSTNAIVTYGTSGVATYGCSLPAFGSTLTALQANDTIMMLLGGANSALTGLSVSVVVRPIQDIIKLFNVL